MNEPQSSDPEELNESDSVEGLEPSTEDEQTQDQDEIDLQDDENLEETDEDDDDGESAASQFEAQRQESMRLARFLADRCAEKKALNIQILDMSRVLGIADCFVICSALSDRQCRVIAQHCDFAFKELDHYRSAPMEGVNAGGWICGDFGEIILHVFTEKQRRYYDLESKWSDVPRVEWEPSAGLQIDDEADQEPETDFDVY